jgi:hypothetical protein
VFVKFLEYGRVELAGAQMPSVLVDGQSITNVLLSNGTSPHDFLFFYNMVPLHV